MHVCTKERLALRNNFAVIKKFLITKFDCSSNSFLLICYVLSQNVPAYHLQCTILIKLLKYEHNLSAQKTRLRVKSLGEL